MEGSTRRILIVEDDNAQLEVFIQRLSMEGFEVLQAKDGQDGLKIAFDEHPDLILLDIMMPKMDGLTMMEMLREDSWGKHVPIILLTNLSLEDKVLTRVVKSEPSYYFVKADMEIDDVVKKAEEVLKIQ